MSKAKKGDLIRITNVPEDWSYKNGEIFEVEGVFEAGISHDKSGVRFSGPGLESDETYYAYDEHYEVFRKAGEEDSEPADNEQFIEDLTEAYAEESLLDAVNPNHYKQGRVEVIDIIEDAVQGADPFEAVCQANVLKYALRYRHKNGVEDLRKSIWFTEKLIAYLDAKSTQD